METSKKKQREITWEFFPAMQSLMAEEPEFVKNSEGYKKAKLALKGKLFLMYKTCVKYITDSSYE